MPKFKKHYYSGICLCGHSWENHHLSMVMNLEAIEENNEGTVPGECLRYGNNEWGGLDEHGEDHCSGYIDKDDPDPAERARWRGTTR